MLALLSWIFRVLVLGRTGKTEVLDYPTLCDSSQTQGTQY